MSNQALAALQQRRSIYALGRSIEQSNEQVRDLILEAVRQSPSSFNSQSSRVVVLFNEQHEKFWGFVKAKLAAYAKDAESAAKTNAKIDSFAAGVGSVLFFEDQDVVKGLQSNFPSYADNFPIWSEHSTAMAQLAVWTVLSQANIGASLQHYNPIVDDQVAAEWDIPANWTLRAQLVFGSIEGEPKDKTFVDDAARFKVFGL